MIQAPGDQNTILHVDVVDFLNASVKQTSKSAYDSCFPAQVPITCSFIEQTSTLAPFVHIGDGFGVKMLATATDYLLALATLGDAT